MLSIKKTSQKETENVWVRNFCVAKEFLLVFSSAGLCACVLSPPEYPVLPPDWNLTFFRRFSNYLELGKQHSQVTNKKKFLVFLILTHRTTKNKLREIF